MPKHTNATVKQIRFLYWGADMSMAKIGRRLGIPHGSIQKLMANNNIPTRTHGEAISLAAARGRTRGRKPTMTSRGYVTIYKPEHPRAWKSGYVLEHILVWEQVHNKPLPDGWIIHHLNGIRNDNRPENLLALPEGKHHNDMVNHALKQRIRELEVKVKLLEKALDSQQITLSEN